MLANTIWYPHKKKSKEKRILMIVDEYKLRNGVEFVVKFFIVADFLKVDKCKKYSLALSFVLKK
jgi:hypothetical protein